MRDRFTADERGVSEVIGAILVFGLLIALMAMMQTYAIPAANEDVEHNHNQEVQSDLVKFQETSSVVASRGGSESARIRMGTTYPTRMLFFNPQNPSGELRTVGDQPVEIQNVNATNPEVNEHFGGSLTNLDTKRLEYEPYYNEYEDPPVTVLEYGAVYRDFGERTIVDNPGQIVSGNTISLTFFTGNLSRVSGRSLSIEARPTSAPTRTVTIENDTNDNISLVLPSRLNATEWEKIVDQEENVVGVEDAGNGRVKINLDGSETYNLRMAQIGVGNGVQSPAAEYIAPKPDKTIESSQANRIPVEVRDKFNNPVSGETVYLNVSSGQFQNGRQQITTNTTEDGTPAALYSIGQAGVVTVEASFERDPADPNSGFDPDNKEDIRFKVAFRSDLDEDKPTIDSSTSATLTNYTVCGGEGVLTELSCTGNRIVMHQVSSDYDISDTGGSGLDYLRIRVIDANGNEMAVYTHNLPGSNIDSEFVSPLFPETRGTPDEVEIEVYDKAGNVANTTESL